MEYIKRLDTELKAGIEITESSNYDVHKDSIVKVTEYGNGNNKKTEIQYCSNIGKSNTKHNIGDYVNKGYGIKVNTLTGEIIECTKRSKYKTKDDIRASMKRAVKVVRNNFFGEKNELFVTLTYYNAETEFDKVIKDMANFAEKLNKDVNNIKYMYFIEQQEGRKSWHIHLLLKDTENDKIKLTNERIRNIWGKGTTNTEEIYNIEGVGNYLTKSRSKVVAKESDEEALKIEKGKRIYNCSKNVDKTILERKMIYEDAQKLVKGHTLINKEAFDVTMNIRDDTRILMGKRSNYTKKRLNSVKRFLYEEKGGQANETD